MRCFLLPSIAALILACLGCSGCSAFLPRPGSGELRIVAYNVKSLFDEVDEGTEFPEFSVAKGKWDDARYRVRLANVAAAVLAAVPRGTVPPGPDLLCLEEIENGRVLEALRAGPLAAARYRYSAIAPAEGGPFSVCALSRLPILAVRCHAAALPGGRAGRDSLELELDAGGERLFVIACHWKSKSGGEAETEEARRQAAALVRGRVEAIVAADPGAEVLVCGDLNESPDEYLRRGRRYPTALMPAGEAGAGAGDRLLVASARELAGARGGELALYSPWEESGGYSFSFRGSRERLDNFLLGPGLLDEKGLAYRRFSAAAPAFLADGDGTPIAWMGSSGYSDHLPILLVLGRL